MSILQDVNCSETRPFFFFCHEEWYLKKKKKKNFNFFNDFGVPKELISEKKIQYLPGHHLCNNADPVHWKLHAKFQPGWSFDLLVITKQLPVGMAMAKPHPMW